MNVGDTVVCINNKGVSIQIGSLHVVRSVYLSGKTLMVKCDTGTYIASRFKVVSNNDIETDLPGPPGTWFKHRDNEYVVGTNDRIYKVSDVTFWDRLKG